MPKPTWDRDAANLFDQDDGQLHDIYVLNAAISDWEAVMSGIRQRGWTYRYMENSEPAELPASAAEVFKRGQQLGTATSLALWPANGIRINSFFFDENCIDFDVDVREFTSQKQLDELSDFMRILGKDLDKRVLFTCESSPQLVIMTYEPQLDDFSIERPAR